MHHQSDYGYTVSGMTDPKDDPIVERHGGFIIRKQAGVGYWWTKGDGCFETLSECRRDIDDWNHDHFDERDPACQPPDDTPCLDRPWWETEV